MDHELATAFFVGALIFTGWALFRTVRDNWTRIKEALRGEG